MRISREYLSNPFANDDYEERLERAGAIDLKNNSIVIENDNGYDCIVPINPNKLFKRKKKD